MKKIVFLLMISLLVGATQAALIENPLRNGTVSGNVQHGGILTEDSLNLTDRSHVYNQIPTFLKDKAEYLKLANADRPTTPLTVSFTLTAAADVYLIIDHRIGWGTSYSSNTVTPHPAAPDLGNTTPTGTNKMAWVLEAGFVDQDISLVVDEGNNGGEDAFGRLYKKHFAAGTVTLYEQNDSTNRNMYGVAVIPEPATMVLLGLGSLLLKRRK